MRNEDFSAFKYLEENITKNEKYISVNFNNTIEFIKEIFNLQYYLLQNHLLVVAREPYVHEDSFTSLVGTALLKNMYALYSACDLTTKGLVGSARVIMRNIYEFLIIAKYASLSNNKSFISKWKNGDDISIQREIFQKVIHPNSDEMKTFWKLMCQYTHSTVYSQQIDINCKNYIRDVELNFIYLRMLLEMNYHVLNTYFINQSIAYYAKTYEKNFGDNKGFKSYKDELKQRFKNSRAKMEKEPRKVLFDFKLKWQFKI